MNLNLDYTVVFNRLLFGAIVFSLGYFRYELSAFDSIVAAWLFMAIANLGSITKKG